MFTFVWLQKAGKARAGLFSAVVVAALAASAALGQECEWLPSRVEGPSPRARHAMCFDPLRGVHLLFGGFDGEYLGDTWTYDGAWTLVSTEGPPPRRAHAMVFDEARGVVVLFGGTNGQQYFGDTWEWNGLEWRCVAHNGPRARRSHAMAYDQARGVTVLFGGTPGGDETWEWDGQAWRPVAVGGPVQRHSHVMVYDSIRGATVLFGGYDPARSETWEWDGIEWVQRATIGPPPRARSSMVFDTSRGVAVVSGGYYREELRSDVWEWDGGRWRQVLPRGFGPRMAHAMSYDSGRGVTVLFGGTDQQVFFDDTLEFGGCDLRIELTVNATCPRGGPIQVSWSGTAPLADVALIYARGLDNTYTIPNGHPCEGTPLGLGSSQIQLVWRGDAGLYGTRTLDLTAGPQACGGFLRLLELDGCNLSNVAIIE